jgi:hypothetical protein
MKRLIIICASAAAAAVPAVFGLAGNPSFSQSVPVQVPPQVKTASVHNSASTPAAKDDHGKHAEPGDDRGTDAPRTVSAARSAAPTQSPAAVPGLIPVAPRVDDHGVHAEPGDDHGVHAEPGDDHGVHAEPGDDNPGAGSGKGTVNSGNTGTSGKGRGGHDDAPGDK